MFIRTKQKRNGRAFHYLVKSERHEGRVRQKTLVYLGEFSTIEAALEGLPALVAKWTKVATACAAKADAARQLMHPAWIERNGGVVPRPRRRGLQSASKLFSSYWFYHEGIRVCEHRARDCAARLDKLRAATQEVVPTNVSLPRKLSALQGGTRNGSLNY